METNTLGVRPYDDLKEELGLMPGTIGWLHGTMHFLIETLGLGAGTIGWFRGAIKFRWENQGLKFRNHQIHRENKRFIAESLRKPSV